MFGAEQNYLAGAMRAKFGDNVEVEGGIFIGRTCELAPIILIDPDAARSLGADGRPFTGFYVFAKGWVPVIPGGCVLSLSMGVGAGAFLDFESHRYGGKIFGGLRGKLLCIMSVSADVTLTALSDDGDFVFDGLGRLRAKIGPCPFCVTLGKDFGLTYRSSTTDWTFVLDP